MLVSLDQSKSINSTALIRNNNIEKEIQAYAESINIKNVIKAENQKRSIINHVKKTIDGVLASNKTLDNHNLIYAKKEGYDVKAFEEVCNIFVNTFAHSKIVRVTYQTDNHSLFVGKL